MIGEIANLIVSGVFFGSFAAVVAVILSPLQYLKVMRQQTGDSYSAIMNDTFRTKGAAAFFRGALPYATMQFLSSMAFGMSEAVSVWLLQFFVVSIALSVIARSVLGGFFETMCSLPFEVREIERNKGELIESKPRIFSVMPPILFRNIIFWAGSVIGDDISKVYSLGLFSSSLVGLVFGVLTALISIPADVVGTRDCGAESRKGVIGYFKIVISGDEKVGFLLRGTAMRIIQIAIYTATTIVTITLARWTNIL